MKLLVTGASGLIGRHVVQAAARDPAIRIVATSRHRPEDLPRGVAFRSADLTDPEEAAALVETVAPTHLVHAAWETRHPSYWEDVSNLRWAAATAAMARSFAECDGRRFVQLGSCAEYEVPNGPCIEGVTPDRPTSRYGKGKREAYRAVEAAADGRFEAVEARIFFVFGPGENPARLIPVICRSHLAGEVPALGSGRQKRDLLFAEDAADAILAVSASQGMTGIVNIGSGEATSLADVAERIAGAANASSTGLGTQPDRADDPALLVPAVDRLRSIGWRPRFRLEEGLARTFAWWRTALIGEPVPS